VPTPGMGIHHAKRLFLGTQRRQYPYQHQVLEDIGHIAGVEGVSVIHGKQGGVRAGSQRNPLSPVNPDPGNALMQTAGQSDIDRRCTMKFAPLFAAGLLMTTVFPALADEATAYDSRRAQRIDNRGGQAQHRLDEKGNRIDERLDNRGQQIDNHAAQRAERLRNHGKNKAATVIENRADRRSGHLDNKGNRVNDRLDHRGQNVEQHAERKADRVERRHDRRD